MGILKGIFTLNPKEVIDSAVDLTVDVIKTPINVVKDVSDTVQGEEPKNTKENLKEIIDDIL